MTIFGHELRRGKIAFIIWTAVIGFMLCVSILIFPEMKKEMDSIGEMFSSMGAFTAAFGMDKLNFGQLSGYYSIECGNVLGLGGAFFAAMLAAGMLSKEERGNTAEFLFTHPVSRTRVVSEKLLAVLAEIAALNLIIFGIAAGAIAAIGETVPWKLMVLMHLAYFFMQLELAGICYGVSAFIRKGGVGIGIGIAAFMYFLNIIANLTRDAEFLKYITPYGYCDGGDIAGKGNLDWLKVAVGLALGAAGVAAAYWQYRRKDIK
ncbi:MAG: ABC transporter permease subunit [Clostridia bacterium]|nr:ABC transporter permease subunit [Clostridia bacterium]